MLLLPAVSVMAGRLTGPDRARTEASEFVSFTRAGAARGPKSSMVAGGVVAQARMPVAGGEERRSPDSLLPSLLLAVTPVVDRAVLQHDRTAAEAAPATAAMDWESRTAPSSFLVTPTDIPFTLLPAPQEPAAPSPPAPLPSPCWTCPPSSTHDRTVARVPSLGGPPASVEAMQPADWQGVGSGPEKL